MTSENGGKDISVCASICTDKNVYATNAWNIP